MTQEQIMEIISKVGTWVASVGGVGTIVATIMSIIKVINANKRAKLGSSDKNAIADLVVEKLSEREQVGIELDVTAQIEKATDKRISACEEKTNELIAQNASMVALVKRIGKVVGDMKSINRQYTSELNALLSENDSIEIATIETAEKPKATVIVTKQEEQNTSETAPLILK